MINLILLPFRGLVWLVLGSIFSLPWLIILLPVTTNYWLPYALSYGFEHKTQALCKIEKANANWMSGEISLEDVSIFNTPGFHSTDCMRFKNIQCKLDLVSIFGLCFHIKEISFDCYRMSFVKQNGSNNFIPLGKLFAGNSKKAFIIDDLRFNFNGFVSIKSYDATFVRGTEFFTKKNFSFSNICNDVQLGQTLRADPVISVESVYNSLGTLFEAERTL